VADVVRVKGLREVERAFREMAPETKKAIDRELVDAGKIVARDAARRFSPVNARSAAGFKSRVRSYGRLVVEQRRRRTTGKRPDYGALQMRRALLPARQAHTPLIERRMEQVVDLIARHNGF
jgi:hypothetical protein